MPFPITPGLDAVWGYEPSLDNMRKLLDIFAFEVLVFLSPARRKRDVGAAVANGDRM